jgi:hypothetical protein
MVHSTIVLRTYDLNQLAATAVRCSAYRGALLDRNRRSHLQIEYNNWYYQPASAGSWQDFVEATAKSDLEIGYLQGLKDRDQHSFEPAEDD